MKLNNLHKFKINLLKINKFKLLVECYLDRYFSGKYVAISGNAITIARPITIIRTKGMIDL